MTSNTEIFESINTIYGKSKGSKLKPGLLEQLDKELGLIAEYIKGSKKEAFIFSVVFSINFESNQVSKSNLAKFFNCSPVQVLPYQEVFESLRDKKILLPSRNNRRQNIIYSDTYLVNLNVANALAEGLELGEVTREVFTDPIDLLEELDDMSTDFNSGNEHVWLQNQINEFLLAHKEMPLIKKLMKKGIGFDELYLFLTIIWSKLEGERNADPQWIMREYFPKKSQKIRFIKKFKNGQIKLVKNNFLHIESSGFASDLNVTLTEEAATFLAEVGVSLTVSKARSRNIISPEDISNKELIYNKKEGAQIDFLFKSLQQEKLKVIQENLKNKGLPEGVVILLHGPSGTGKTETVFQLAKQTNREIMHVDISQTKSSWFGESEQRIKGLFYAYNSLCKKTNLAPILLFNEADGVLSKRRDVESSNVSKTENAMQNILLEELEKFEGIMIATSNMVDNIDSAFERRFLFKILMDKPDKNAMSEIWKIKFPMLQQEETVELANSFQFSGGQVDNILKKFTLNEIVFGEEPTFQQIKQFCQDETIYDPQAKIGFLNKAV